MRYLWGVLLCSLLARATWWRSQIDYLKPPNSGNAHEANAFIGSPSILQTEDGHWFASHDRFFDENPGTSFVFSSANLTNWEPTATITPMYWAQLFANTPANGNESVYIIGTSGDLTSIGDLVISRCESTPCDGTGWTKPQVLFAGNATWHFHTAPTPVVRSKDRTTLYRAFDVIVGEAQDLQVVMLTGNASCVDLTKCACWSLGESIAFDSAWMGGNETVARTGTTKDPRNWEEPGAILDEVTGSVSVMVRIDAPLAKCTTLSCFNRAVLLSFDPAKSTLSFEAVVPFPSSCNKFAIRQEPPRHGRLSRGAAPTAAAAEVSTSTGGTATPAIRHFYTLSNPVTYLPESGGISCGQRNYLILARTEATSTEDGAGADGAGANDAGVPRADLKQWRQCAVVAWDDTGLGVAESVVKTGLQYVDWRFAAPTTDTTDTTDTSTAGPVSTSTAGPASADRTSSASADKTAIVAAVRAGYDHATTYHDANRLLLTRVRDYRSLCEGVHTTGVSYGLGILHPGLAAFTNREYVWRQIPTQLQGLMFSRKGGGDEETAITLVGPSAVGSMVAFAGVCPSQKGHDPNLLTAQHWKPTNLSIVYTDKNNTSVVLYQRSIAPGERLKIEQDMTWCGTMVFYRAG
jgi:hypothetical protein